MTVSHVPERYPEIDIARGIAVVMMVVFHIAFDLSFLGIAGIPV
ncbi:MAG TPA: heparan-alpha-glucosaminide N-acetyltransferase domain-containing protein, partial [Methanoregulaceae archaeon]|nr:heparan-alpha-glucosaminide N-acetyltransferase domain-containing protein [Methanoregulaceae archaeon]